MQSGRTSPSSNSSHSSHPVAEESKDQEQIQSTEKHEFSAADFAHLSQNEHLRYLFNSKKVGHALIVKNKKNEEIALQYDIPHINHHEPENPNNRPVAQQEE